MTGRPVPAGRRLARLLALLLVFGAAAWFAAQSARANPAVVGPAWSALTLAQQQALAPLQPTWDNIDAPRKKKWLEVADRFPRMPAEERQRVRERMAAWAAMTPGERAQARLQFQETRRIGPEERAARWQAYQSLPEEERKRLAQVAANRPGTPNGTASGSAATAPRAARQAPAATAAASPSAKRNVVAATPGPAPRSVAPTVVQAKPGATTTTVATPAKPPLHHQPGLPKIVATPTFVDPTTLLPRRGPQAAAMRAASSDPTQQP